MKEDVKREKLLKFFSNVFNVDEEYKILNHEYARVIAIHKDNGTQKIEFFRDINKLLDYVFVNKKEDLKEYNFYFNLSTTGKGSGKIESLKSRSCIALDFDNKDFGLEIEIPDIIDICDEVGIKYHSLVSTGNGWHVYVFIENTTDLDKVEEVTKCLAYRTGADINATYKTQVMRIPFTFNLKNGECKHIGMAHIYDKIYTKNIEQLYKRHITAKYKMELENKLFDNKVNLLTGSIYPCVQKMIKNGVAQGERQESLIKVVTNLRDAGYELDKATDIAKEFNGNCIPPMDLRELEYQTAYIFDNVKHVERDCKFCKADTKKYCFNKNYTFNRDSIDDTQTIDMTEKAMKKIAFNGKTKKSKEKGVRRSMKGNNLIVYCLLTYKDRYLTISDILEELTYEDNKTVSEKTLRATLKELEEQQLINVAKEGRKDTFKAKGIRAKEECKFRLSVPAMYECIKGRISAQDFRIYGYMRFALHKQNKEEQMQKKNNILRIEQQEIAKALDLSQATVSVAIKKLMSEKIISLYDCKKSKSTSFDYYIYELNY